jgi:ABC-type uncharacterized transport system ATPase subunit
LVENNITVKKFSANEISLQEIFVELAGGNGNSNKSAEASYV